MCKSLDLSTGFEIHGVEKLINRLKVVHNYKKLLIVWIRLCITVDCVEKRVEINNNSKETVYKFVEKTVDDFGLIGGMDKNKRRLSQQEVDLAETALFNDYFPTIALMAL